MKWLLIYNYAEIGYINHHLIPFLVAEFLTILTWHSTLQVKFPIYGACLWLFFNILVCNSTGDGGKVVRWNIQKVGHCCIWVVWFIWYAILIIVLKFCCFYFRNLQSFLFYSVSLFTHSIQKILLLQIQINSLIFQDKKNCIVYKKKRGGKGQKEKTKLKSRFFWRMILLLLVHLSIEFAIGINWWRDTRNVLITLTTNRLLNQLEDLKMPFHSYGMFFDFIVHCCHVPVF